MNIRPIYKIIFLFCVILFSQIVCAACRSTKITSFTDGLTLDRVERDTAGRGDVEVCTYRIQNSVGNHYMYVLLNRNNEVVYCGITDDPKRRAGEHHRSVKIFDQMVALGRFDEETARDKEKECVCQYDPGYNHLPTCQGRVYVTGEMIGGGEGEELIGGGERKEYRIE